MQNSNPEKICFDSNCVRVFVGQGRNWLFKCVNYTGIRGEGRVLALSRLKLWSI